MEYMYTGRNLTIVLNRTMPMVVVIAVAYSGLVASPVPDFVNCIKSN